MISPNRPNKMYYSYTLIQKLYKKMKEINTDRIVCGQINSADGTLVCITEEVCSIGTAKIMNRNVWLLLLYLKRIN